MIRWGFLGAGWIATTALAPAVTSAPNATLFAVASRDENRSRALGPSKVHASYEALIEDPDVDAIYISLANHQHCEWTIKALNAGKHVLCEKPLAMNGAEVREMAAAATANDRLLVEAVWSLWHPRMMRAAELVKAGDIGQVESIDASFTFNNPLENNYRLQSSMGGGSLLDVGPYLAHSSASLLGNSDINILSVDRNLGVTGVDLTTQIHAEFGGGVKFSGLTSFERDEEQLLVIQGDAGIVEFLGNDAFTSYRKSSSLRIGDRVEEFAPVDAYAVMVEDFGRRISGEDAWVLPIDQSIYVADLLGQVQTFSK